MAAAPAMSSAQLVLGQKQRLYRDNNLQIYKMCDQMLCSTIVITVCLLDKIQWHPSISLTVMISWNIVEKNNETFLVYTRAKLSDK